MPPATVALWQRQLQLQQQHRLHIRLPHSHNGTLSVSVRPVDSIDGVRTCSSPAAASSPSLSTIILIAKTTNNDKQIAREGGGVGAGCATQHHWPQFPLAAGIGI